MTVGELIAKLLELKLDPTARVYLQVYGEFIELREIDLTKDKDDDLVINH